jgi:hypothetical protein
MPAPLISSGLRPDLGTFSSGHECSSETLAYEAEGFRAAEAVTWEQLEAMDFVDLCLFVGVHPKRFREMISGVDVHDEEAVSYAIRAGIHRIAPSLDDYGYLVIRHLCRPLAVLEAAE